MQTSSATSAHKNQRHIAYVSQQADVADEVCIGGFPVFGDPVFCCEKHCACALYVVCLWSGFSDACAESSEFVRQGASPGGDLGSGN